MKDIKLVEVVYFLMERVMRQARENSKAVFREMDFNVTIDQWIILKRVSEESGISQIEIANSTFKDPAAVTRILDILEKKKLVIRGPRENDRRTYDVHLTNEGTDLVRVMTPVVQDLRREGLKGFEDSELESLKKYLNRIYQNLQ